MLVGIKDHNYCDVSIIIPVYNGSQLLETHVAPLLSYLQNLPYTIEVIITDDGSADQKLSAAFARSMQIIFTGCDENTGKGAALRAGFAKAVGAIQLFTDADIPFEHHNILALITALKKDTEQLMIGDRMHPESVYFKGSPLLRNMGSFVVAALVKKLLFKNIYDTQCGLKGMGKQVAVKLFKNTHINRFAIDIELIYLAKKQKIPVTKMPVQLRYNDKSSVQIVSDGWQLLMDIFRIKKLHNI